MVTKPLRLVCTRQQLYETSVDSWQHCAAAEMRCIRVFNRITASFQSSNKNLQQDVCVCVLTPTRFQNKSYDALVLSAGPKYDNIRGRALRGPPSTGGGSTSSVRPDPVFERTVRTVSDHILVYSFDAFIST